MRKYVWHATLLIALSGAAVSAQKVTSADGLDKAMKNAGKASGALAKALGAGDFAGAKTQSTALRQAIKDSQAFWADKKKADGVQFANDVLVKVDAFPYARHGYLKGKLFNVSEESFASNGAGADGEVPSSGGAGTGAFHRGRVLIAEAKLESMPEGARLIPGMTLRGEIKVGSRSVLSYFLSPITRVVNESIREP